MEKWVKGVPVSSLGPRPNGRTVGADRSKSAWNPGEGDDGGGCGKEGVGTGDEEGGR